MTDIRISDDAGLLARLHGACFDPGWSRDSCASLLKNPVNTAWILQHGDAPAAFLVMASIAGESEILTIGTLPDHRGQGLASILLIYVMAALESEQIFLEVRADNRAAIALYEKLDFTHTGYRKNYYKPEGKRTRDALIYSKKTS